MVERRTISLDDLARHSPWPARLLGQAPWTVRTKTRSEVAREFGLEKWSQLEARLASTDGGLEAAVHAMADSTTPTPTFDRGALALEAPAEAARRLHGLAADAVAAAHRPGRPLVELGAGFGPTLLTLARRIPPSDRPLLIAGELTESGQRLAGKVAAAEGVEVDVRACDLTSDVIMAPPPPGSVVFTVYGLHYVTPLTTEPLARLASWQPSAVVHVEPVHELCPIDSTLGLLQRRYLEVNGYTTNILTTLRALADAGKIEITSCEGPVYGPNALLPASIITWVPVGA